MLTFLLNFADTVYLHDVGICCVSVFQEYTYHEQYREVILLLLQS